MGRHSISNKTRCSISRDRPSSPCVRPLAIRGTCDTSQSSKKFQQRWPSGPWRQYSRRALWLPVKMLSVPGEQALQPVIMVWIASRPVRGLFINVPNSETMSGVHPWRSWRSALQAHCPCMVVVPQGFSQAHANVLIAIVKMCSRRG